MSFRRFIRDRPHWRWSQRRSNPNAVTQATCSGWLRKQGGKFKSWKRRFFILNNETLTYYEKEDCSKILGQIHLKSMELEIFEPSESTHESHTDIDRFHFLIKPGDSSNRVTPSHESFLLAAVSEQERTMWTRQLKRAIYRDRGGAIFGFPLFEIMAEEEENVPLVVEDCVKFVREYGMTEQGIFRMCGRKKLVNQLAQSYDRGLRPVLEPPNYDVHTVCGVLKKFFMDLPEPLIPYDRYDDLKATGFYVMEGGQVENGKHQLERLPKNNYILLKYLCRFLLEVSQYASENMMTIPNLASIFAPHILRCHDSDPNIEASATYLIGHTMEAFILYSNSLFIKRFTPFLRSNVSAHHLPVGHRNGFVQQPSPEASVDSNSPCDQTPSDPEMSELDAILDPTDAQAIMNYRQMVEKMFQKVKEMDSLRDERDLYMRRCKDQEVVNASLHQDLNELKSQLLESQAEVKRLQYQLQLNDMAPALYTNL